MEAKADESVKIRGIMECSVCLESFQKPKCLPCVHTFCLKCLEGYGQDKGPGDQMRCPVCRQAFVIPSGGLNQLPKNFLMEQLLEVTNLKEPRTPRAAEHRPSCETCSNEEASNFCQACCQHMCHSCSNIHRKSRSSRLHRIVNQKGKQIFVSEDRQTYCLKHTEMQHELYCNDCEEATCPKCFIFEHNGHAVSHVQEVINRLKSDVRQASGNFDEFLETNERALNEMTRDMEDYLEQLSDVECVVKERGEEVKRLVDSQVKQLLEQLEVTKTERVKVIKTQKDDVERQLLILRSYQQYVDAWVDRRTPCDVIHSAKDLLKRADEIVTSQKVIEKELDFQKVFFQQVDHQGITDGPTNFIGTILVEDNYIKSMVVIGMSDESSVQQKVYSISLSAMDTVKVIDSTPTCIDSESAACVRADSLYAVGLGTTRNELWRYSSRSKWVRLADLPEHRRGHCVVVVGSMLYVLGGSNQSKPLFSVLCYIIKNNTWSTVGELTRSVRSAACLAYRESVYVFGGVRNMIRCARNTGRSVGATVQVYNTRSQICTLSPSAMPKYMPLLKAVLWKTSAILIDEGNCLMYNFETQTWQERSQFKIDLIHFDLFLNNETLYIVGGSRVIVREDTWMQRYSGAVKSVNVLDIITDKPAVWKHHAKLSHPVLVQTYSPMRLRSEASIVISRTPSRLFSWGTVQPYLSYLNRYKAGVVQDRNLP